MTDTTSENEKTWDAVADLFTEASALPVWGPFGIGEDLNLIPEIEGKTFLEVGCGSGRSIKYLTERNAKKVYGLDLSSVQLAEAERFNKDAIDENKVILFKSTMEEKIDIEPVDVVFSVYAIGWTADPEATFRNIYSYLKEGGQFIWSWDHAFFSDVVYEDGKFVVEGAYHEEEPLVLPNWKKKHGVNAHLTYRKVSTWFGLLRKTGFDITGFYEPQPKTLDRGSENPAMYYSIQKAEKVPCSFIFVCTKPGSK